MRLWGYQMVIWEAIKVVLCKGCPARPQSFQVWNLALEKGNIKKINKSPENIGQLTRLEGKITENEK